MARSGRTEKISISLDKTDLEVVRRRAKRVHGGNISKVIADAVRYLRYEEGRDALIDAFGDEGTLTTEECEVIAREWQRSERPSSKRRGGRAA